MVHLLKKKSYISHLLPKKSQILPSDDKREAIQKKRSVIRDNYAEDKELNIATMESVHIHIINPKTLPERALILSQRSPAFYVSGVEVF